MIVSFSGDDFLARRAARRFLAAKGLEPGSVQELGEGLRPEEISLLASQSNLFGPAAVLLDFGAAFTGQAGIKARNDAMAVLEQVAQDSLVVVIDPSATAARKKLWRTLGDHVEAPTPRYEALPRWVKSELDAQGVRYQPQVPAELAALFGEDPAALVAEIGKLSVLDEEFGVERVRQIVNRPASRDAFDMIDAIAAGDAGKALAIARQLLDEGEAPQRIFGALVWQFGIVAKAVALIERQAPRRVVPQQAATTLKVRPFVATKALKLAAALDEPQLRALLTALLAADVRAKSGGDAQWALESLVIRLAAHWGRQ